VAVALAAAVLAWVYLRGRTARSDPA